MIAFRPDVSTARRYLHRLAAGKLWPDGDTALDIDALATWLVDMGLGPLAYNLSKHSYLELAARLKGDAVSTVAENTLHFDRLQTIQGGFSRAGLPLVLLKGAALAEFAYGGLGQRQMTDVDIWIGEDRMADAVRVMHDLGFEDREKGVRPRALQKLSRGEIQFYGTYGGLVELHWSPFPGWWLRRVAATNDVAVWSRLEPLPQPGANSGEFRAPEAERAEGNVDLDLAAGTYHLAAEDAVIQSAVHNAVNHQFGKYPIRGLMDIVLTARARPVEWPVVVERAWRWKLATSVWIVLQLADQLIGLEEAQASLVALQPSRLRRRLLLKLVSPDALLGGVDYRTGRMRYLLLLFLADRPKDAFRLIYRTLWPESEWIEARYGGQHGRLGHLWAVVRHGRV